MAMMTNDSLKETYDDLLSLVERQRDEINVKMHLASMEVKDEWAELEKKYEQLKGKGKLVKKELESSAEEIEETFSLLGDELKEGYQRIKKLV